MESLFEIRGDKLIYLTTEPEKLAETRPLEVQSYREYTRFVFPYNQETVSELTNLGLDTRWLAPFRQSYRPDMARGVTPMPHQWTTAEFLVGNPRSYNTSDTRTGKTMAQAMALDYLRREPGSALIVCPLSVMESVWDKTLRLVDPYARCGLLRGSKAKRLAELKKNYPYYIVNYDGLTILEDALKEAIRLKKITKVVVDELNHFGNPSAKRYQVAEFLFNENVYSVKYLWGLTGTPGADSQAVYGMARLVNYKNMMWKSKSAWQGATQYKWGTQAWQWRDRTETPEMIQEAMTPAIRFTREQVLPNLPPVVFSAREAELSKAQDKYYRELKRDLIVQFERGETITADQKSALLGKLFQICLGVVISPQGLVQIDNKPRIELLKELIAETNRKTVIYCHFTAVIDDLVEKLSKQFSVAKVDGSVTGQKRDAVFRSFRDCPNPRVLIAHQKTVAYGTELAAADQLINNGPQLSGVSTYSQGCDRASSLEQTSDHISIIDVYASPEEKAYMEALNARKSHSDIISNLFNLIGRGEL
jgi:superfamily II DNA or RNA helicase